MSGTKIDFRGHALLPSVGLPLRMASSKVGAGATQITVMHKSGLPPQPARSPHSDRAAIKHQYQPRRLAQPRK